LYKPNNIAAFILLDLTALSVNKLSSTINLTLRDEVPQRGEDILNNLLLTYNRLSMEEKKKMGNNTLAFIDKRLAGLKKEIDSIEQRIQSFKTDQGVVDLTEQSKMYLDNVGNNDRKIADLSMQLAGLDEMEEYVNSKDKGADIMPTGMGITDPVLSDLMQKLYTAKVEYESLLKTTAENNPTALAVAKEIEQLRPLILQKLKTQRIALEAGKKDLTSVAGSYNSMLHSIPQKERELLYVSREQIIKKDLYSLLLDKREEAALASVSATSENKIVDMAQPSILPVSPKKKLIYFAAFVGAIGIGIGIVSGKELLSKKILFRSEIESFSRVPVIAEISAFNENESLLITNSRTSVVAEQFRHLRAAMGLFKRQKKDSIKRILVTSSISKEGKTFVSSNLATSLALAGNKVVLVDLDIRIPKTSAIMGVANKPGVAEFLKGTKTPEEIIIGTANENLFVIGAGIGEDKSRELILNGKLNNLLAYLSSTFDYIVIDASPIDPVSDSYIFSEYCDVTLFVIRHGRTPKAMVQILDSNSKFKALKNPQIVFNGIRSRGVFKHMYGYGYGYGYENVYRDRQEKKHQLRHIIFPFQKKKLNVPKQQVL
jgi:capsular exopolysaccharide synthesis family protein